MRKIFLTLCLAACLSACSLAPGMYLNTDDLQKSSMPVKPLVEPTLIPISSMVTHHRSKYSACHDDNGSWICDNRSDYQYRIGQGDVLTIIVYDHPELTNPEGEYRSAEETGIPVNPDGTINYPFVGRVQVAGLTVEQVGSILEKRLAKYIQSPQINVRVSEFNYEKIQVLGEVNQAKTLPITNVPLTLLDALNDAGGVNLSTANGKFVYVVRGPASKPKLFWLNADDPDALLLAENFYLQNRDVVYVSTAGIARWNRFASDLVPSVGGANDIDQAATRK